MKFTYFFSVLLASSVCGLVAAGCWDDDEVIPFNQEGQHNIAAASTNQTDPTNHETHLSEGTETRPNSSSSGNEHNGDSTQTEGSNSSSRETHSSRADAHGFYNPHEHTPAPLRLKIFDSDAIVRATLISSAARAEPYSAAFGGPGEFPWGRWVPGIKDEYKAYRGPGFPDDSLPVEGEYRAVHTFQFRVIEYLKGSGASEITVQARTNGTRGTEAEAMQVATASLSQRDTSRDTHEAILFLGERYRDGTAAAVGESSQPESKFQFLLSGPYPPLQYTIDTLNRVWLPAKDSPAPAGTASSTDDSTLLFLSENSSGATPSTISLQTLRSEIAAVEALVGTGGGTEEFKQCVVRGWLDEHLFAGITADGPLVPTERTHRLASGAPEGTAVASYSTSIRAPGYNRSLIGGVDKDLFKPLLVDDDDRPDNGYTIGEATARPLPAGTYQYKDFLQVYYEIPCNFIPSYHTIRNVVVTAPAGTLHELFFDPVTVGSTVVANATNGVLKPTGFTASNGASATVESISYEAGTVKVKVVPWSSLSGQILDFIELDGRVSLSLSVTNSTVHSADNEFVWPVGPQPWDDGDKLMVRIRRGFAAIASPPASVTATASGGESVNLSWDAGRGASGYQVERRESGVETWEMEDDSVTERSYVVSGLSCETSYDFRVGAYGDGRKYEAEVKSWSAPASETTGACTQPPTFDAASYSFEVSEDAAAGTQVGTVSATDPDVGDTLTYSIVSGNEAGKFAVDGSTGVITVSGTLDYETVSSYTLTVEASDGKGGTARATVTIGVVEVVDTGAPVFGAGAYAFSVIEGAPVGSTVGAVSATDPNEGDTVTYSITAGNDAGKFGLDAGTGRITLTGTLDYQTTAAYTLTVEASDGKDGKGTATVTVSVEQASCSNGTAVASPSDNAGLVKDCLTLLTLRDSLEGTVVLNWSSDVAIGNWKGVSVAGTPRRVQSLSLSDLGLDGTVPSALAKLSGLELLELSENDLTGAIPTELSGLTRLGRLSLGQNGLTGSIPPSLSRLSNLYSLAVGDNDLSGSIPSTLGSLSRLIYLSLGGNDLTGTIPSELGSLASLQYLYLDTNDLTGGIPTQLGSLAKLEILSLYGNKLTGGIPSELGNLSKLEQLMLSRNGLTGSIPSSLERLSKLVYLRLSGNRLTGCIPASLRNVTDHDLARLGLAYCAAEA